MKLQQLRYLREVERQGLNLSTAADKLHTSQPGISKQIKLLEDELGVEIFVRNGKRVTEITPPGKAILAIAQRILQEADNLKQAAQDFSNQDSGSLTIATTHTQARYALPAVIQRFTQRYPKVKLGLMQGNPVQISQFALSGQADFCIATEAIATFEDLVMLPCYGWNRCVVAPPDHPILKRKTLTLEAIAEYPVITYDFAFTGRSQINHAFETKGLKPNVILTAIDSDVIKTYVALGLGIGILAKMAFDPERDSNLRALDASHLFESSTTRIGIPRNAYLRRYIYDFIEMFAPHLTRKTVDDAVRSKPKIDYDL
ncbi:MAG TPA: HTH-type transcriptional regulator CysB [Burkholderiales bacterium]|jgi:LysR family cys regulon transcriptional activator|nr:HTH-type transcriptional regulator CysB [Burkholderiales bacterium]